MLGDRVFANHKVKSLAIADFENNGRDRYSKSGRRSFVRKICCSFLHSAINL